MMHREQNAATTVSATMEIAAAAGVQVFATGGIGGVHRGAETSFDISADLGELARTPVCVVAAGAKAIVVGKGKCRTVPVEKIVTGPGKTSLKRYLKMRMFLLRTIK